VLAEHNVVLLLVVWGPMYKGSRMSPLLCTLCLYLCTSFFLFYFLSSTRYICLSLSLSLSLPLFFSLRFYLSHLRARAFPYSREKTATATPATFGVVVVEMRDCETPGCETERHPLARLSSPRIFISRRPFSVSLLSYVHTSVLC